MHQLILSRTIEPLNWIRCMACSNTALQLWPGPDIWEEEVKNSTGHNIAKTILQNKFLPDSTVTYSLAYTLDWLLLLETLSVCSGWRCHTKHIQNSCPSGTVPWVKSRTTEGCHQQVLLSTSTQCPEHNSFSTFHFTARIVHQSPNHTV